MRLTQEQVTAFLTDIRAVCEQHGIAMLAGCKSEGILGEIVLLDKEDAAYYTSDERSVDELSEWWPSYTAPKTERRPCITLIAPPAEGES